MNALEISGAANALKNIKYSLGKACASQTCIYDNDRHNGESEMRKIMNLILTPAEKRPNYVHDTDLIYKHGAHTHTSHLQVPAQDDYMCRYVKARDGNDCKYITRR